jgi:hypothetical protein
MPEQLPPDVWRQVLEQVLVNSLEDGDGSNGIVQLLPVCKEWTVCQVLIVVINPLF